MLHGWNSCFHSRNLHQLRSCHYFGKGRFVREHHIHVPDVCRWRFKLQERETIVKLRISKTFEETLPLVALILGCKKIEVFRRTRKSVRSDCVTANDNKSQPALNCLVV